MATPPRRIIAGTTYLVTRRCVQRQFLLTPSSTVNAVFEYTLALTVARYGILLHGFCVMSNHFHLVITDPAARLPDFLRDLDTLLARALNLHLGRSENFFSSDKPSYVELLASGDVISKLVYTLSNPVTAGLVPRRTEWPGAVSRMRDVSGAARRVRRPRLFFSERMPDELELRLCTPLVKRDGRAVEMSPDEVRRFRRDVRRRTDAHERRVRERAVLRGRRFVGAASILRQCPFASPSTPSRSGMSPRIAAADKHQRCAALEELRGFITLYYEALKQYRDGFLDVVFPAGTFKMRALFGVRCECIPLPGV
jgi:REP element-mobilizing transposase RayT